MHLILKYIIGIKKDSKANKLTNSKNTVKFKCNLLDMFA